MTDQNKNMLETEVSNPRPFKMLRKAWNESSRATKALSVVFAASTMAGMAATFYTVAGFSNISKTVSANVIKLKDTPLGEIAFSDVVLANNAANFAQVFAGAVLSYACLLGARVCVERVRLNNISDRNTFQCVIANRHNPK